MFKTRLSSWGLSKNATKEDWQAFAILRHNREAIAQPFSRVEMHKKIKSEKDFRNYLRHHKISEEDFVRESLASSIRLPSHIRYCDPESPVFEAAQAAGSGSQQLMHPDQPHQGQTTIGGESLGPGLFVGTIPVRSSYLPAMDIQANHMAQDSTRACDTLYLGAAPAGSFSIDGNGRGGASIFPRLVPFSEPAALGAFTDERPGSTEYIPSARPNPISFTFGRMTLPSYLSQAIEPEVGVMPVVPSYNNLGGMLGQLLSPGPSGMSVLGVDNESGRYNAFMFDTMMACISAAAKEFLVCGQWLHQASLGLRRMCSSLDHLLLPTLSTVLVWLQVHDEGGTEGSLGIAESLMREFSRVAADELGRDASLCRILQWMIAAAGKKLETCRIDSEMLQQVWIEYRNVLGYEHPSTIVALYCLSFHLLKVNKSYMQAEIYLRRAHEAAVKVFGASHLQSLNILATLSRTQSRQGNLEGALDTIKKSVNEEPLGQNHPHRLMLMLRMALIYGRMGKVEETEQLYWIVVEGRAATLGPQHKSTKSAYASLVHILRNAGKWEFSKERVQRLLSEPQVAVSAYETWWHHMVEQGSGAQQQRASSEETE